MYSYCYVCSVLYILFSSCHLALFGYPDRFLRAFSSIVRQMPGYNSQRRGTARTLPNCCVVLRIVCFVSFCVSFVCKCVLYHCHRVSTHLKLTNNLSIFKTPWRWQPGVETCGRPVLVMKCILLSANVGGCIDRKNKRGMDIIKLAMNVCQQPYYCYKQILVTSSIGHFLF
jgi:hypothetical protein